MLDRIEAEAEAWRARFGTVPRLRAALHGGSVVTAEVGVDRHKIAYFGDAVNVTSRIEALCRPLGVDNLNDRTYWAFHPYTQRTLVAELRWDL